MALLSGKTAVITGGIDRHRLRHGQEIRRRGRARFITGRRQAELDTAVKELGDNATGIQGDVGIDDDLDRLYRGGGR